MTKLFLLDGKLQNYDWGGKRYIADLLRQKGGSLKIAEYWLGAHKNAPAVAHTPKGAVNLDTLIHEIPIETLGEEVAGEFGRLPFLFKVLDVEEMLSIQVHPTKAEAIKGFKRENEAGIPRTASNRNYKDDNHKPEIMVALSEFWLLHGFLTSPALSDVLLKIPEFNELHPIFKEKGYYGLYKTVMQLSQEEVNDRLRPLINRILPNYKAGKIQKSSPDYWAAKACDSSNDPANLDRGIFSIYFFNVVQLNEGEAIFQDAGLPHAYLEGQNIELMANSDNVLRGGLTPKHIDVEELLKHVKFEETLPNVLRGQLQEQGMERIYKSPVRDFELSKIVLTPESTYNSVSVSISILILISGSATITQANTKLEVDKGKSALLLADSAYSITTSEEAIFYKATVPRKD
ncbi:MAG: mannose-6-phosphate isomerase, class I [Leeuwenhoekiella sp.]